VSLDTGFLLLIGISHDRLKTEAVGWSASVDEPFGILGCLIEFLFELFFEFMFEESCSCSISAGHARNLFSESGKHPERRARGPRSDSRDTSRDFLFLFALSSSDFFRFAFIVTITAIPLKTY
jgi:hypothetical protein